MDLAAIVKSATGLAFNIAGTAKTAATLHTGKTKTYDPATDTNVETGGQDTPVEGIFFRDRQGQKTESNVELAFFLVNAADAPNGIDEADTITLNSADWNIYDRENLQGAAYLLSIRK